MNTDLYYNVIVLILILVLGLVFGFIFAWKILNKVSKQKITNSLKAQKNKLTGSMYEQWAPYLSDFEGLDPTEARFLGSPVDFVVFKGMNEKNITEVVFVEIKTGQSRLNQNERSLREAINQKNIRYIKSNVEKIGELNLENK